jgi:hypothetical protein
MMIRILKRKFSFPFINACYPYHETQKNEKLIECPLVINSSIPENL